MKLPALSAFLFALITLPAMAQEAAKPLPAPLPAAISAFRSMRDFQVPSIAVPTVVKVPFDGLVMERADFAVFNQTTNGSVKTT